MIKAKKNIIVSLVLAMVMLFTGTLATTKVYAAGEETLPIGSHYIGSFTFTDTNLTKPKTMPNGAYKLVIGVRFRKAATDQGIGQVKLKLQIRDTSGHVLTEKVVNDTSSQWASGYVAFITDPISVSAGQKVQIYFDALSVNPSQSNGNYRSIEINRFDSFINMDTIIY